MAGRNPSSTSVLAGLTGTFLLLAAAFAWDSGKAPENRAATPAATPAPQPATVRMSAAQLIKSGGDASGLDCYACHDQKKPPELKFDANHRLVFPKEHSDLIIAMRNCATCHTGEPTPELKFGADGSVIMPQAHQDLLAMAHGRNNRNDNCFNCHNSAKLNEFVTREGTKLTFAQAPLLCASCHGPTYRDWEAGVHGRTNGYWNKDLGPATRQDCTSCHDPHAPAFPAIIPLPGPHTLHAVPAAAAGKTPTH